ncbi:hypothetical protein AGR7A_Lc120299 [Agrobacterium deltaense NCPPB 1641]|uniref:Uncharacterized protein n=1 Tax=Agrobacterium deltaense NCPPB 1641 TaxID=1183425 RepID=A0A1S7TX06_9HYPH|nr:hypothetical protein AGR7A_Lc120299 [Agrobacterium deltaense NCPPB 1641]
MYYQSKSAVISRSHHSFLSVSGIEFGNRSRPDGVCQKQRKFSSHLSRESFSKHLAISRAAYSGTILRAGTNTSSRRTSLLTSSRKPCLYA